VKPVTHMAAASLFVLTCLQLPAAEPSAATSAPDAGSVDTLDGLRGRVRIGAEIFLDPSQTREDIQKHFARMKEVGLTVARMFIIWDHVEHRPGEWKFDLYDHAYDAAAANGMHVLTTLCPEDPPGWMRRTPFWHSKLVLNTPELRERAAEYLQRVVSHFKDHPAQGPWSLANEPAGLAQQFDAPTLQQFGQWLEQKYGTVERLNERWFRPQDSFQTVSFGPEFLGGGWIDFAAALDWRWFRIQQQSDQLAWVRDQVRRYDTRHLTHANPSALAYNMPGVYGADLWSQKQVLDFVGTTIHASWQLDHYRPADTDLGVALITDLLRSGSGGSPWWITELQAGLSLYGERPFNPTAAELTRCLWDSIGAGGKGVIFWCWHPRRFGREGGEWGLVNADASPTTRSDAVTRVTQALAGPAAFLHRAEPLPPRAAILYSRPSLVLAALDERTPREGDRVILSLLGCHRALCGRQIPVEFINEDDLRRGVASHYAVLYLPYVYALDDDGVAAVRHYASEGGTVWADGPLAWKDERGHVRPEVPGGLREVFGVQVEDFQPVAEPFQWTGLDSRAGAALRLPVLLRGAEVLAHDTQGRPVATRHRYGKGTAYYYGTALTLGFHRHPDPQAGEWLAAPARAAAQELPVSATTDAPRVFFRGLKCPEGLAAILSNPGEECSVRVAFRGEVAAVEEVLGATRLAAVARDGMCSCDVKLPAGGVSIVLARHPGAGIPGPSAR